MGSQFSGNSCLKNQPLDSLRYLTAEEWKEKIQGMLTLSIVDKTKIRGIFEKCKKIRADQVDWACLQGCDAMLKTPLAVVSSRCSYNSIFK